MSQDSVFKLALECSTNVSCYFVSRWFGFGSDFGGYMVFGYFG